MRRKTFTRFIGLAGLMALALVIKFAVWHEPRSAKSAPLGDTSEWHRELLASDNPTTAALFLWRYRAPADTTVPYNAFLLVTDLKNDRLKGAFSYGSPARSLGAILHSVQEAWGFDAATLLDDQVLADELDRYDPKVDAPAAWEHLAYVDESGTITYAKRITPPLGDVLGLNGTCRIARPPVIGGDTSATAPDTTIAIGYDDRGDFFIVDPCIPPGDPADPVCISYDPCVVLTGVWPHCESHEEEGCCYDDAVLVVLGVDTGSEAETSWWEAYEHCGSHDAWSAPFESGAEAHWSDQACCPECHGSCHGGIASGSADAWTRAEGGNQCANLRFNLRVDQEFPCDFWICCVCDATHQCCPWVDHQVWCGIFKYFPEARGFGWTLTRFMINGSQSGKFTIDLDKSDCVGCPLDHLTGQRACASLYRAGISVPIRQWDTPGTHTIENLQSGLYFLVTEGEAVAIAEDPCQQGGPRTSFDACNGEVDVAFSFTPNPNTACPDDANNNCTRPGCDNHACELLDDPCCGDPCPPPTCCDDANNCTRDCRINDLECGHVVRAVGCELMEPEADIVCSDGSITVEALLCNDSDDCGEEYRLSAKWAYGDVTLAGPIVVSPSANEPPLPVPADGCSSYFLEFEVSPSSPPGMLYIEVTAESTGDAACGPATRDGCNKIISIEYSGVDLDLETLADEDEEDPGAFLHVNEDDDNGNGTQDRYDNGPTVGEDDLKRLSVTADGEMVGTLTLELVSGGSRIRLYEQPDRSVAVTLPVSWELGGLPKSFVRTYYVEGYATSDALGDVEFDLTFTPDQGDECGDVLKVTVYDFDLKEVEFYGGKYRKLRKDVGPASYGGPHWQDNSYPLDEDADDVGDRRYPAAYIRSDGASESLMKVRARFEAAPLAAFAGTARIRGVETNGMYFEGIATTAGGLLELTNAAGDPALPATVAYFDPFHIDWAISPAGQTWIEAGASENPVYVVLGEPDLPADERRHTLFRNSCRDAAGATTDAEVLAGVWSDFIDRVVMRADPDANGQAVQLKYYDQWTTQNIFTPQLLAAGDGQCGSWTSLFLDMLRAHGINYPNEYVILRNIDNDPTTSFDDSNFWFTVKNWSFASGNGISGDPIYPYLNIPPVSGDPTENNPYVWRFSEHDDAVGTPGQGTPDPKSLFNNHQVVKINGSYYDPSYGKNYPSLDALESDAMAGFNNIRENWPVNESEVNLDLNGDGDTNDVVSVLRAWLSRTNAVGNQLREVLSDYPQ